jgi:hypothetical protein
LDPEAVQVPFVAAAQLPHRFFDGPVCDLDDQLRLLRGDTGLGITKRHKDPLTSLTMHLADWFTSVTDFS